MANLISWAKKKKDELERRISGVPNPVQTTSAPMQQKIANAKYGVLANNKQRQQSFTQSLNVPKPNIIKNVVSETRKAVPKVALGTSLAATRVGTDVAQGVSGLVDLATPGRGTSRVSKSLDRFAKNIDSTAKNNGVNASYRVMQTPLTIASFYGPGGVVKAASTIPKLAKGANVVNKMAQTLPKAQRAATALSKGNIAQRIVGRGVQELKPINALNAAAGTAMDLGRESGKGRDISKTDVAISAGMNLAAPLALPMAGQSVLEAGKGTVKGVKRAGSEIKTSYNKKNTAANYDASIRDNQKRIAELDKRIDDNVKSGNPNWRGIESLNKHKDILAANGKQLEADRPKMTLKDKLLAPNIGLSMARVHSPDLSPQQNKFIEEYATMLKDMGQGNGVDITPDGRRISNNVRDADVKGKQLNNSYWFDKARAEIESGKAAYGASDEYKAIGTSPSTKPAPQSPATAPPAQPPAARGTGQVSLPKNTPDYAESNFPLRVMEDERADPIRRTLEGNAYHEVKRNKDTLEATAKGIADNEDKALALAKRGTSTEANATSLQLLEKYLSEGNMEKADDLLQAVLPRFTRQGQQTQILAAYSKTASPAGAIKYAQQQFNKAAAKSGRSERLDVETDQLHKAIDQTNREASKQIETELSQGTLGNASKVAKQPKTPEQMLADRIKASTERKTNQPDPIKDMVNTLHKVAKEVLPEQSKNIPRDPMQLIGAAIRDKQTYGDTYDRAKAIVMDKYRDNPEALAELETYFSTDAARTYAAGQLNKGVQTGLKGTDLGKLVREHYTKVDETGADLKAKLIERAGLSDAEAGQLAADIQRRFSELTGNKKQQILDQMFSKTRNKPEQKDAVQKILELSNLGAFGKDELRSAVGMKLGVPSLSGDAAKQITQMADTIQQLPEGSPERNRAAAEMLQFIHKQVPSSMTDKVMGAWTAGLISGGKTITGAPVSNVTNALTRTTVSPIAAGLDFARTAGGTLAPRSNTLVSPMNYVRGFKEGIPKSFEYFKTGIDERAPVGSDYPEINYDTKAVGKLVNGVFRLMGALDRPFYYGQKALSQAEVSKLERLNKGKQFNQKTPEELVEADARISVLDFDTVLSKIGSAVKQSMDKNDDAFSRGVGKVAAQLNAPFVRIPSAGLSRMIDFSPMGAPLNIARQVANMKFGAQKGIDWRSLNTAIGESATGTGTGLVLGYMLAQNGLVTGEYPSSDPKEAKYWEANQIQPNSVKINGTWVSMNYLGPFGSLLQQGRRFQESQAEGNSFAQSAATSQVGVARDALNQSYLQGINSSLEAARDPQRALASKVNGTAGTLIPATSNDIAVAFDSKQRQVKSPKDAIQARIPGARNFLPVKQDVYGNELDRKTGAIGSAINPLRPSDDKSQKNPVVSEVSRLRNADRQNKDLQVTPTAVGKTLSIEGQKVKLNDKQRYDLQKQVGQATQKAWGKLITTSEYKALDDTGKAETLKDLRTDVAAATQRKYVVNNNLAAYDKEMNKKQQAVLDNDVDVASYTEPKSESGGGRKSDAFEKQLSDARKDYEKNKSKMSRLEQYKAEDEIKTLEVKKNFTKGVVGLYGANMSKDEVYRYLNTDPDGNRVARDLLAYGDALVEAGLTKTNKFRDSKGNIAIQPKAKGSGSGGSKADGFTAAVTAAKAGSGASSLTKVKTGSSAPSYAVKAGQAPAGYKQPALKRYNVKQPKISLRQLAKLG